MKVSPAEVTYSEADYGESMVSRLRRQEISEGARRILEERQEQIFKHGHTDKFNHWEYLKDVAMFCMTLNDEWYPNFWNLDFKTKMENTSMSDRLIYAGAFLAAAYDKLNEKE